MTDPDRAPFFSGRNVPLWIGVILAVVVAGLMVWRP